MRLPCLVRLGLQLCLAAALLCLAAVARAALPLQLPDDAPVAIDAWPAVTLLSDPDGRLDAAGALRRLDAFRPPDGPHANLGARRDVVWVHLPVQAVGGDGRWVLDLNYPPLQDVQLWQLRDGQLVLHQAMGSVVPFDQRAMPSRSHAITLSLPPGERHELLLRVSTTSAMLLPISMVKPLRFHALEAREQLLQGLLIGVALALVAYSLSHWLSLRDPVFLAYALIVSSVCMFFVFYFGIGQQHLWNQQTGLVAKFGSISVLLALTAAGPFVFGVLQTRSVAPRTHRLLMGVTVVAALACMAALTGVLDSRQAQMVATVIGPLPMLLVLPLMFRLAHQGNQTAQYMLLGWTSYMGGALIQVALLRGWTGVDFWSLHAFQLASLLETLAWTRVLALRIADIRVAAERSEAEKQALVSLAHTDALTGLPNRRGMQQSLAQMLPLAAGDSAVAVYLLDLDGFKPVNDRLGHDAGDELLVQVSHRLKQQLRHSDLVARLGGDEFVITTTGLAGEDEALLLGRKLLDAFNQPFEVGGQSCRVGLTIGFALAPHDGREAESLLKQADAAMYAGKQAGRHTVRRGGASAGLTFSS